MSLEQAIQDLSAALKENTALVRELSVSVDKLILQSSPTEVDRRTSGDHKEVAEKVIEAAKKAPAPVEDGLDAQDGLPTVSPSMLPAAEDEKTERLIDLMTDVVPVFQKLCVNKGRDAGAAILAKWSVAKLSQVPADKLGELLVDIQKAAA